MNNRFFKALICVAICVSMVMALAACSGGASGRGNNSPTGVADVLQAGVDAAENGDARQQGVNAGAPAPENVDQNAVLSNEEGIDVDLTSLSSTMVYSEVYNIMNTPENYVGKTIKMNGVFAVYQGEEQNYYACIIKDAAACCSQGIEFVLAGDPAYPEGYPEEGAEITVVGVFDTYEEGQYLFCTLRNADLL